MKYQNISRFEFRPGAIDLSDLPANTVQKRGDSYVLISYPSALRVQEGSILYYEDARGIENMYQAVSVQDNGSGALIGVIKPTLSDAVINMDLEREYVFTPEDFTPAEGVTIEKAPAGQKDIYRPEEETSETYTKTIPLGSIKYGTKDSVSTGATLTASGTTGAKVKYRIVVKNGVVTEATCTDTSYSTYTFKLSMKTAKDFMQASDQTYFEEKAQKEKTFKDFVLETSSSFSVSDHGADYAVGGKLSDLLKTRDTYDKLKKAYDSYKNGQSKLGDFWFGNGIFTMHISVGFGASVSGSGSITLSNTSVTQKHFDFAKDDWVIDQKYCKDSIDDQQVSMKTEIEGKIYYSVDVETGFAYCLVKDFQFTFEIGIKLTATWPLPLDHGMIGRYYMPCMEVRLIPYEKIEAFAGAWFGGGWGVKKQVLRVELTLWDLLGLTEAPCFHVNLFEPDHDVFHMAQLCPFRASKQNTIHYVTKTQLQVQDLSMPYGTVLDNTANIDYTSGSPSVSNLYHYTHELYGSFLGWAWKASDTAPTAASYKQELPDPILSSGAYDIVSEFTAPSSAISGIDVSDGIIKLTSDIKLYAVWSNQHTVTFDVNGSTSTVSPQSIPYGGFISDPGTPSVNNNICIGWTSVQGSTEAWDFFNDPMPNNDLTLYAIMADTMAGDTGGGTDHSTTLGNPFSVPSELLFSADDLHNTVITGLENHYVFRYEDYSITLGGETITSGIRITGVSPSAEKIVIPSQIFVHTTTGVETIIEMKKVVAIAHDAFSNNTKLRSVKFDLDDSGIESLDLYSMFSGCTNLVYAELPKLDNGMIGSYAFSGCESLLCVRVRAGFRGIGSHAFQGCTSLKEISFPDGMVRVDYGAFEGCTNLEKVVCGQTMQLIQTNAFYLCSSLTNLTLNQSLQRIEHHAFTGCNALETLRLPSGLQALTVDDNYNGPFVGCTGLKHIDVAGPAVISTGMLKTGSRILEDLTIRKTVSEIGYSAFNSQNGYGNGPYNGAWYNQFNGYRLSEGVAPVAKLIFEPGATTIIGPDAFAYCNMFAEVSFPQSLETIQSGAFAYCTGLTSLVIPGNATIGSNAFLNCTNLEYLDLGQTQVIDHYAFRNCTAIKKLVIPPSVSTINVDTSSPAQTIHENGPFVGCTGITHIYAYGPKTIEPGMLKTGSQNLRYLYIGGRVQTINYSAFYTEDRYLDTPYDLDWCYKPGYAWMPDHETELEIGYGVQEICPMAFMNARMFTHVTLSSSLTKIGNAAFSGCVRLSGDLDIVMNDGVIAASAFANCKNLTSVRLSGVSSIESGAFYNCTSLGARAADGRMGTLDLGDVASIDADAFKGCASLTELYIPDSVTVLGVNSKTNVGPFTDCLSLRRISVGGVEEIQEYMLRTGSQALQELVIRGTVKRIGYAAFNSSYNYANDFYWNNGYNSTATSRTVLRIEEGVESIDSYAFGNCTIFTEAHFPSSLKLIDVNAFYHCTRLSGSLSLPAVVRLGSGAFANCSEIKALDLGNSITEIGEGAFMNCSGLTQLYIPDSVQKISVYAESSNYYGPFTGCTSLRKISIGGVEEIQEYMLRTGSQVLQELEIRGSVKRIGNYAFISENPYNGIYNHNGYQFTTTDHTVLRIQEGVESIGDYAFSSCKMFTEVHIPASVTEIGTAAFNGCTRLQGTLTLEGAQTIGNSAFFGCEDLTGALALPSVETIGDAAFYGCAGFTSLDLGNRVTSIGARAFSNCSGLDSLYLPDSVKTLGVASTDGPFTGCTGLRRISVGGVEEITSGMLRTGSQVLQELEIRGSVKRIGSYAFMSENPYTTSYSNGGYDFTTTNHTVLRIQEGVESIGFVAFRSCGMFTEAHIPASVTFIDGNAFSNCSRLSAIEWTPSADITLTNGFISNNGLMTVYLTAESDTLQAALDDLDIPWTYLGEATHSLLLIPNGGTLDTPAQATVRWGDILSLPEPAREGFIFAGWYQDEALTNRNMLTRMPAQDLTLYAAWVEDAAWLPKRHSFVTLQGCGGSFDGEETILLKCAWGAPVSTLPLPAFDGHTFSGWYTDADHTMQFTADALPAFPITLWAGWDIDCFMLSLDANGGAMPADAATQWSVHAGDTVHLPYTPSRPGHTFVGWYLDSACTQAFGGVMPFGDTVLYAGWAETSLNGRYRLDGDHATLLSYTLIAEEAQTVCLPEMVEGLPLTAIGPDAFRGAAVKEIWLPAAMTDLDTYAFRGADLLQAFHVHPDNAALRDEDGILYSADGATLLRAPNALRSVTIPSHVRVVGAYAFDGTALESARFLPGVTEIGAYAFHGTSLQSVTLPATLQSIGDRAFSACAGLRLIRAEGPLGAVSETAFADGPALQLFYGEVGDNPLRRAAMKVNAYYNRYMFTLNLPNATTLFAREAGEALAIPADLQMPENTVLDRWYLDEAKTTELTSEVMPASDLTLYAGTAPAFETESYEGADGAVGLRILSTRLTGNVVIPGSIDGTPVLAIASNAFGENVTSLRIPASVIDIAADAMQAGTTVLFIPGSYAADWAAQRGAAAQAAQSALTLHMNNGLPDETISGVVGSALTLPTPVRNGYALSG